MVPAALALAIPTFTTAASRGRCRLGAIAVFAMSVSVATPISLLVSAAFASARASLAVLLWVPFTRRTTPRPMMLTFIVNWGAKAIRWGTRALDPFEVLAAWDLVSPGS